jgi:16S rRNA (uracil1498-N3)-methyltransferase
MMQLFYDQHILPETKTHFIEAEESKHILRVLRKQVGDEIYMTNGNGYLFKSVITSISGKKCQVEIVEVTFQEPPKTKLHIAIAPTKSSDRFEFFLEKATEIGISEITPLISKNSERKRLNLARCEKIIQSAMKQSKRVYLPKLNELVKFESFLETLNPKVSKYIAHCEEKDKVQLSSVKDSSKDICFLIGPEGDFTPIEIDIALQSNFKSISLSSKILRTETAGIYVCMAYSFKDKL